MASVNEQEGLVQLQQDFERALRDGNFAAAAKVWAEGNLPLGPGVAAFEKKLASSIEDQQCVIGETAAISAGEFEYLGDQGKGGARLAFTPAKGSLNEIVYLRNQSELLDHLVGIGASQLEQDMVVSFFALSEHKEKHRGSVAKDLAPTPEKAEAQSLQPADGAPAGIALPGAVAEIEKRMRTAHWFSDYSDDSSVRIAGANQIAQLREDFRAVMQEYPVEAMKVWQALAPKEYQMYGQQEWIGDLQPQMEAVAPEVIQEGKAHDLAEVRLQESAEEKIEGDTISAAPATSSSQQKEDNAIQVVTLHGGAENRTKQTVDTISRAGGDSISNAKPADGAVRGGADDSHGGAASNFPKTLLNGRFILRDHGQYFRVADGVESTRVALIDESERIRFVDKQMDAFQAAIELAKHKKWEAILVTGTEKFRAEAWHHARIAGLEVVGYDPTEKDLETLKAAQEGVLKSQLGTVSREAAVSLQAANDFAIGSGYGVTVAKAENGRHVGKVIHETDKHIVQDVGRQVAVVHEKGSFDQQALREAMGKGKSLKIQYQGGRAAIEGGKARGQELGR